MRFLNDREIGELVSVPEAAKAVEEGFRALAGHTAVIQTRVRTPSRIGKLSSLGAILEDQAMAGAKVYTTAPDGTFCFAIVLFDPVDSRWLAALEAGELTRIRTAGTSLMAARALARPDSTVLVVFGAGVQARTHALALADAFPLTHLRLIHRRPVPELIDLLRRETGIEVVQVEEPDAAVSGADLVVTATRTEAPLFRGDDLKPGTHITSVGATVPASRELDAATIDRADRLVVESRDQARYEAGNLIGAAVDWDLVDELPDLAAGTVPGRTAADQITVFDSLGSGMADIALAALCYRKALDLGRGTELPSGET